MTKDNFRISAKHFMLTYKSHLQINDLKYLERENTHKIFHEIGKTGYEHTHVIVAFKQKFESRNPTCFDVKDVHPNIKRIQSELHWRNCANYNDAKKKEEIEKLSVISDTLTGNEYKYKGNLRNRIQAHRCWRDVMNDDSIWFREVTYEDGSTAQRLETKHLQWVKEVFKARPKYKYDILKRHGSLLPWQDEALKRLLKYKEEKNDRKVIWIYDKLGGNGKTHLFKHIISNYNAMGVGGGKSRDNAFKFNYEDIVAFNLVRTQEDFTPYTQIEQFKDGYIESPKYMSEAKIWDTSQVIVFANYYPDKEAMSSNRWDIGILNNGVLSWELDNLTPRSLNIKGETVLKSLDKPEDFKDVPQVPSEASSLDKPDELPRMLPMVRQNNVTTYNGKFDIKKICALANFDPT